MKKFNSLLPLLASEDTAAPAWVVSSFPIIKIILAVLIMLCAIALIILILSQKTESDGSNAITGQADTFYNRNKGESLQGKIRKTTIGLTISIFVLCIIFLIINFVYRGY